MFLSIFPSGRWVVTGEGKSMITSESNLEEGKKFCYQNDDTSPEAVARAEASAFNWPAAMFEPPIEVLDEAGNRLFTDRGNRLTFDRVLVTDNDISLALLHAQQKFGRQLTLNGDDPVFTARMARLADDIGIVVLNPELQNCIQEHRRLKAQSKI